jgi:predicted amidohydrolase
MKMQKVFFIMIFFFSAVYSLNGIQTQEVSNLVLNPGFEMTSKLSGLPEGWKTASPRKEIEPEFTIDNSVSHSGKSSARITSKGSAGTFGYWTSTVNGVLSGTNTEKSQLGGQTVSGSAFLSGNSYTFGCWFKTSGIDTPGRNIWINVTWLNKNGEELFSELVSRYREEQGWFHVNQVITAPQNANSLKIKLILQWSEAGVVWWDDVSLQPSEAKPAQRKIKVATSNNQPAGPSTAEKNLEFYSRKIIEAGKTGADLICLGEGITIFRTGKNFEEAAETIPGPATVILGEAARKSGIYVVAGIYEREGSLIYNTAVLIDRNGNIAGKYRKTHLPETEVEGGLTPGDNYPVFKTDFGTIGIQVCYDNFFPEVIRSLAVNGAEIIVVPIWGDRRDNGKAWEAVARSRAIDNTVYLISSMYNDEEGCMIIDPNGHILKDSGNIKGLLISEIDLNERTFERWLSVGSYGEWKNLMPQERRSETYNDIIKLGSEF